MYIEISGTAKHLQPIPGPDDTVGFGSKFESNNATNVSFETEKHHQRPF
jgi:hypothetical protein